MKMTNKHRIISFAICLFLVVGMLPISEVVVRGSTEVISTDIEINDPINVYNDTVEIILENNATVTLNDDVTLMNSNLIVKGTGTIVANVRINIDQSVSFKLEKNVTLEAKKGIDVLKGESLVIDGKGTINAYGTDKGFAGIGASDDMFGCGEITINGGIINAYGGTRTQKISNKLYAYGAAGIGGSGSVDGDMFGGVITIYN